MSKKIIISLGVIAVLAAYLVISNWECSSRGKIPSWDESSEIVISGPGGSIRFHKKNDRWVIGDGEYPADPAKVENIEKSLKDLTIENLVSKKGFFKKYELTPDRYTEATVKKGKETLLQVKFGKKSSTGRHTFIRIGDGPEIYLATGTYDSVLKTDPEEYRDRAILKITGESVTSFEISHRGRVYSFEKKTVEKKGEESTAGTEKKAEQVTTEEKWVFAGNEALAIDTNRVTSLLNTLNPLRASSFPDLEKDKLKNRLPLAVVRIKAFSKEITLSILYKNSEDRYVSISSESPYVFTVDEWMAKKFFINSIDTFLKKE